MTGFDLFIQIGGGVALLLWATRLVRTGIERAYGQRLQQALTISVRNRVSALLAGLGVTTVLQSSTATALLTVSFAQSGMLATTPALAIMLGADLGSTAVVQVLSFDLSWLAPVLLVVGVMLFQIAKQRKLRHMGRILIGIGLMLVSLKMIVGASGPLRESEALPAVIGFFADDPVTAFALAAVVTWLAHSSVAMVLLIMSLAASAVVPVDLAFVLVLGANVGSGLIPFFMTLKNEPEVRRIPLGNLLMRVVGALACLWLLPTIAPHLASYLGSEPSRQVANFHSAFNLVLALFFLPLTDVVSAVTSRILKPRTADQTADGKEWENPSYLDASVIDTPRLALACASREVLRMADKVEAMLRRTIDMFQTTDLEAIGRLVKMDDEVDKMYDEIKLYIAKISRKELTSGEASLSMRLSDFNIKLEHIGDIIERNLTRLAAKRAEGDLEFSKEGWGEIVDLHARVVANMQLALNVLVSSDVESARELLSEKSAIRELERESSDRHLARLAAGQIASIRTSSIHLDAIKDLRQINSQLASVAYFIPNESGDFRPEPPASD